MVRAPWLTLAVVVALAILIALGAWQWRRMGEKQALQEARPAIVRLDPATPVGRTVFVFAVLEGRPGWRSFTPMQAGEGLIFVDWAFTPGLEPPAAAGTPPARLSGVRAQGGRPNAFTTAPDLAAGVFYTTDLPAMAAALDLPANTRTYIAADYAGAPNPFPMAALAVGPERHLGYALTWWGLAAGLVVVFLAVLRARAKGRHGQITG